MISLALNHNDVMHDVIGITVDISFSDATVDDVILS